MFFIGIPILTDKILLELPRYNSLTYSAVSSGFRLEWYSWKSLSMRIKKNIGTIRPNPIIYEIWADFFSIVKHEEK